MHGCAVPPVAVHYGICTGAEMLLMLEEQHIRIPSLTVDAQTADLM